MPNSTSFPRAAIFRWWREEKPSVAYADVLTRGIYTARKERVEANTPHFLPPLPAGRAAQSPGARGLDGEPGESFDRAGHGQSHVERALRRRPGRDHRGLRHHGPAPLSSPAARLAGSGIPRERLGHEAYVQAHGDVRHLPPECEIILPSSWPAIRRIFCWLMARASAWMPRCCVTSLSSPADCW